MARKIMLGTLMALSALLLVLSVAGIVLVWVYNKPLTRTATTRLTTIDTEMAQAQTALQGAQTELERTLRLVESAEQTLAALKEQLSQAQQLFGSVSGTLDEKLIPSLAAARDRVNSAKRALEDVRASVEELNSLPFISFTLPGSQMLADLIGTADSIDGEIARVENLAKSASTFMSDMSYLSGGDLSETKQSLQNFLVVVQEYDGKLTGWRRQVADLLQALPGWIDSASIFLTVFLLWFGFSQAGLFLHALTAWRGGDPLAVLRKPVVEDVQI